VIIIDTNVVSELARKSQHPRFVLWFDRHVGRDLFLTATIVGELVRGVAVLPAGRRKTELTASVMEVILEDFAQFVLPFDRLAAYEWGELIAREQLRGRVLSFADSHIAAVCLAQGASLATRNTKDFEGLGIDLIDPWE